MWSTQALDHHGYSVTTGSNQSLRTFFNRIVPTVQPVNQVCELFNFIYTWSFSILKKNTFFFKLFPRINFFFLKNSTWIFNNKKKNLSCAMVTSEENHQTVAFTIFFPSLLPVTHNSTLFLLLPCFHWSLLGHLAQLNGKSRRKKLPVGFLSMCRCITLLELQIL